MGVRSRPLSVAAAVALAASGLAAVTALPAAAATSNTVYKPLPHTFQSMNASPVVLQARGYINDVCLLNGPPAECPKGQVYRRPEVNAQAQVIRRLSGTAANPAAPDQAGTGAVQWEVRIPPPGSAPGTTSTPAPATSASAVCNIEAGNANGSDTAIHVADVAQPPPSATPCPWRLDVTLDHPGGNPGVMEVKRWRGQATRNAVDTQLDGYLSKLKAYNQNLIFVRDTTLNVTNWAQGFVHDGVTWCVWADRTFSVLVPNASGNGNIYFAPYAESPDDVKTTPGSDGTVCSPPQLGIEPSSQSVTVPCPAEWTVRVGRDPAADRTLTFAFGDGTSQQATVPKADQSTTPEYQVSSFQHSFGAVGPYTQTSTVDTVPPTSGSALTKCQGRQLEVVPAKQGKRQGDCANYDVTVQPDPANTASLSFDPGDGSPADVRSVAAGLDPTTFLFIACFTTGGTYTQTGTFTLAGSPPVSSSAVTYVAAGNTVPAAVSAVAGGGGAGPPGTNFSASARVSDAAGHPIPGVPVEFSSPPSGASCTFPNGTNDDVVFTDASGNATDTCGANTTVGTFTITANQIEDGVTTGPATFNETVNAPPWGGSC